MGERKETDEHESDDVLLDFNAVREELFGDESAAREEAYKEYDEKHRPKFLFRKRTKEQN